MDKIKAGFMTQLYRDISAELKLTVNNSVLEEMETKNREELEKLTGQCRLFSFFFLGFFTKYHNFPCWEYTKIQVVGGPTLGKLG